MKTFTMLSSIGVRPRSQRKSKTRSRTLGPYARTRFENSATKSRNPNRLDPGRSRHAPARIFANRGCHHSRPFSVGRRARNRTIVTA